MYWITGTTYCKGHQLSARISLNPSWARQNQLSSNAMSNEYIRWIGTRLSPLFTFFRSFRFPFFHLSSCFRNASVDDRVYRLCNKGIKVQNAIQFKSSTHEESSLTSACKRAFAVVALKSPLSSMSW